MAGAGVGSVRRGLSGVEEGGKGQQRGHGAWIGLGGGRISQDSVHHIQTPFLDLICLDGLMRMCDMDITAAHHNC